MLYGGPAAGLGGLAHGTFRGLERIRCDGDPFPRRGKLTSPPPRSIVQCSLLRRYEGRTELCAGNAALQYNVLNQGVSQIMGASTAGLREVPGREGSVKPDLTIDLLPQTPPNGVNRSAIKIPFLLLHCSKYSKKSLLRPLFFRRALLFSALTQYRSLKSALFES